MKSILLTFDLEEFDLSNNENEIFNTTKRGVDRLVDLLERYNIKATFFTTAIFAGKFPKLLKKLAKKHEIACHGYSHLDNYKKYISKINTAKRELEKITGKEVIGFRAPRFEISDISSLEEFGFKYDSSIHPTFIPGRYFHLFKNRNIHKIGRITEIPLSVLPVLRLPIFWLAFKNLPLAYSRFFTKRNFSSSDYTMLIFHPWEFADLNKIKIPKYMKKKNGKELLRMLEEYIKFCRKKGYNFSSVGDYLNIYKQKVLPILS